VVFEEEKGREGGREGGVRFSGISRKKEKRHTNLPSLPPSLSLLTFSKASWKAMKSACARFPKPFNSKVLACFLMCPKETPDCS